MVVTGGQSFYQTKPQSWSYTGGSGGPFTCDFDGKAARIYFARVRLVRGAANVAYMALRHPQWASNYLYLCDVQSEAVANAGTDGESQIDSFTGCLDVPAGSYLQFYCSGICYMTCLFDVVGDT